jgi:hypothetical protein
VSTHPWQSSLVDNQKLRRAILAIAVLLGGVMTCWWWADRHPLTELVCRVRAGQDLHSGCLPDGPDWAQRARAAAALVSWAVVLVMGFLEIRAHRGIRAGAACTDQRTGSLAD